VTVAESEVTHIDVVALMTEALSESLDKRGLAWHGEPGVKHLRLDVDIVDYEPGNAFKRWLLPGYGSTILQVQGQLIDVGAGSVAGTISHERSVFIGGAYTIGAWKVIFDSVADDIAREIEKRAEDKDFVVTIAPWATRDTEIPVASKRQTFLLRPIRDSRPDKRRIGERTAAFDVSMGNVYFARSVPEFIAETVADELRAAGHTVDEPGGGREVEIELVTFWAHTDTTPLYWDVVGEIELRVQVLPAGVGHTMSPHEFSCRQSKRTYVWPSEKLMSGVLDDCLQELMAALRTDSIWLAN
jgi:hypothetical protein